MINIDTSTELHLLRFQNGVKLVPPQNNLPCQRTIGDLLKLSFPIYFNADKFILECNEVCADVNGFISREDSIGKKWYEPYKLNTISETLRNEEDVIKNNKYKIIEDILERKDDVNIHALSFKMPWYNNENKIIGLFGCSVFLGKQSLAETISQISELGLLNQTEPEHSSSHILFGSLSKREKECLNHFLKGKTAKQTAEMLGISYRTIEEYFSNIKKKLNCQNKRDILTLLNNVQTP